jgi:hypothetical protein
MPAPESDVEQAKVRLQRFVDESHHDEFPGEYEPVSCTETAAHVMTLLSSHERLTREVERLRRLLLEIAEDATDGPINPGLNSVQEVLAEARATQEAKP